MACIQCKSMKSMEIMLPLKLSMPTSLNISLAQLSHLWDVHSHYLFEILQGRWTPHFPTQNQKDKEPLENSMTSTPPMGLSGLVRSEGARTEKDSKVKDIKREVRGRAIGSPFLFPLWAMGRAVWIAMLIGSWKYEEITQNPLDFLTPTWVGP